MELADALSSRCLFAIPKKGRLYDKCIHLLKKIDLRYSRPNRLDVALCNNFNIGLVFLPASDIALYVAQGKVDMGITGQDIVAETSVEVKEVMELGFGECKLSLQVPKKSNIKDPKELVGKRIVTSFPNLAKKYFSKIKSDLEKSGETGVPETHINYVSGSVEVACSLGLADAVIDLVESGETMRAAGLEALDVVVNTQAILIANPKCSYPDLVEKIRKRILGVITAEKYVMIEYNAPRSKIKEASQITPGQKSPTITPLDDPDWVAIKALILRSQTNDKMDSLQELGARDILITNVDYIR